jgi:glutamine amidotransferase
VYKGTSEILLSQLILDPAHSILTQSYDSRLRLDPRRPHNGDGFGIGYYVSSPQTASANIPHSHEPCIFTSTIPAWNCINLERLASKTTSNLIFAHVRATTEGNLSDQNCHPFSFGRLMFMHNGGIGNWKKVKRQLADSVGDEWYGIVKGNTDSEWAFALFLDSLDKMGHNPTKDPGEGGFGHIVLRKGILRTIERINEFTEGSIKNDGDEQDSRSLLNFAVTDGDSIVCSRYVSSAKDEPASLFFSSGTSWELHGSVAQAGMEGADASKGDYKMERRDKGSDIILVASEPLTFERGMFIVFFFTKLKRKG